MLCFSIFEAPNSTANVIVNYIIGSLHNQFRLNKTVERLIKNYKNLNIINGLMVQGSGRFTRHQIAVQEEFKEGKILINKFSSETQ